MIARRMIWQEETPPSYADLAQRKATIVRIVPGETWTRLNAASGGVDDVEIELKFDVDADGLATVAGQASTAMRVACHWCQRVVSAPRENNWVFSRRRALRIEPSGKGADLLVRVQRLSFARLLLYRVLDDTYDCAPNDLARRNTSQLR